MNAERLLANYEQIADAPDAIARLRRFILDLAVRGKLVPQDPADEPASELLKRISKEKARLVKEGEIRAPKAFEPIRDDELPILVPQSWSWARLHDIGKLSGGMTPSMNRSDFWDGDIVWLSPKDIKSDEVADSELRISAIGLAETGMELYRPGCLFMVARSGILKRTFPVSINRTPAAANQDMKVLAPFLDGQERYLQIMFRGLMDFLLRELVKTGTTVQSLKYAEFEQQPFPLPPLAEQHRIVAKTDELMGLCDRLEAARGAREAVRDRLGSASLARLNGPDPTPFQDAARFVLDSLPALTTRPDQIKQLRQTILNLAVRGKLAPQNSKEKHPANLGLNNSSEIAGRLNIEIPSNWRWVRLEDVAATRLGKMLDKAKNRGQSYKYLRNTNVHWFDIRLDDLKTIPLDSNEFEEYRLQKGDVLICEGGHGIGRTAVWDGSIQNLVFQKALHRVRPGPQLDPAYFAQCCFIYFDAGIMQGYFTGVGIPHFTGRALAKLVFPLPPLAEQNRIVAKVDALMALCDRLEASLIATAATRRRLLDALLAEALAPAEERAMEAAE